MLLDRRRRGRRRRPRRAAALVAAASRLFLAAAAAFFSQSLKALTIRPPVSRRSQPGQPRPKFRAALPHLPSRSRRGVRNPSPSRLLSSSPSREAPREVSGALRDGHAERHLEDRDGDAVADGSYEGDLRMWEAMRLGDEEGSYYLSPSATDDGDNGGGGEGWRLLRVFQSDLRNLAGDDPRLAQDALEVMRQMHLDGRHPGTTVLPDAACYRIVLEGYLDAGCPEEAEALLLDADGRLLGDPDEASGPGASSSSQPRTQPSSSPPSSPSLSYLQVAQAWAGADPADEAGAVRAEGLLRRLQQTKPGAVAAEEKEGGHEPRGPIAAGGDTRASARGVNASAAPGARAPALEPSVVQMWTVAVDAWCKRAGTVPGAMERADALLLEMEAAYHSHESAGRPPVLTPLPNVHVYTAFLGGLARSRERDLARRAEDVLDRMRRHGVDPDMVAYTSVLNCWSKAVSRREREVAASRSTKLLEEMERRYVRQEQYHVKPSLITYATAMRAIGRSLDPHAAALAEAVLERMYRLHRTGLIANLKPNTQAYNALLHALSMAPGDEDQKLRNARRAEEILGTMMRLSKKGSGDEPGRAGEERDVEPDVRSWAAVLRSWAQCSWDAPENCQRILDNLSALRESGETMVRPNFVCYTTVMGVWGNSKRRDGLERMEKILKYMEDTYEETLEADVRPNTVSYVTAIDAITRRNEPDAALRAQATVDRMLRLYAKGLGHVRPNRIIFNCLINAYSKSKDRDSAQNAEKIFKWMETQSRVDETVRPDAVSLCGVLNAWANQATPEGAARALQIWNRMQSVSSEDRGFELSIMMPNIVIKAIARTKDPEAVEKVEQILLELEKNFSKGSSRLRPDVTTASSVINAAAYYAGGPEGRSRALEIAMRTFRKIIDWGQEPNNITFGTLLKAVANLVPPYDPRREALARELFDQCCELGYVDGFVLSQVRNASPQLYRELVDEPCGLGGPTADTSVSSLLRNTPSEWSASVVG